MDGSHSTAAKPATPGPLIAVSRSCAAWASTLAALTDACHEVAGVADAYHDRWSADLARQLDEFRVVVRVALDQTADTSDTLVPIALSRDAWLGLVEAFRDGVEELDARSDAVQVRAREAWVSLVTSLPEAARADVQDTARRCLSCGRRLPITMFRQFASGAFSQTCAECHARNARRAVRLDADGPLPGNP